VELRFVRIVPHDEKASRLALILKRTLSKNPESRAGPGLPLVV
jgi:hypothetical protein